MKGDTRGMREGWMEGNYLRLMPGLSLDKCWFIMKNKSPSTSEFHII